MNILIIMTMTMMKMIMMFQVCFDLFDTKKQDYLSADDLDEIMRAMGFRPSKEELQVQTALVRN